MRTAACRRHIARAMLAVLLFAQAALAVAACDWLDRSPARAFAAAEVPSCHEAPAQNVNLCLADCLSDDQSSGSPQLPIAALAAEPMLVVAALPESVPASFVRSAAPPPGPPPRIRFHSFRI